MKVKKSFFDISINILINFIDSARFSYSNSTPGVDIA